MELKDKLDLLWKYLLLLVLVVGMCSHLCHPRSGDFHKGKYYKGCCRHHEHHSLHSEIEDVKVELKIENGDTLFGVRVNGEKLNDEDAKAFIEKHKNMEWGR